MRINWNDPSKNSAADLDAYAQFIRDTDPAADHSDLYRPKVRPVGNTDPQTPNAGTRKP